MAFSFGSTGQSTFGSSQPKPTGFGAPFGATPTTSAPGFGGFGSSFGATSQQPSFGSTFAAPASVGATAPTFGSTFGATPTSTPAFGSTFGAAASTAPSFGSTFGSTGASTGTGLFGTAAAKPGLFGTATTTAPSLFSTPASTAPNLFGTASGAQAPSLFGTTTASATPSLFGSGTTTTTPSLFGTSFGAPSTSAPTLFGAGGSTQPSTGFNLFGGTTTTTAPSLFGSSFGPTATTASGFTGFGTGTAGFTSGTGGFGTGATGFGTGSSGFGATSTGFGTGTTGFSGFGATTSTTPSLFGSSFGPKPAAPQQPLDPNQLVMASVYAINLFNDERDEILKKWNMLQACWGTGKGYFNSSQPPVEYNPKNSFYRFKAVGYNIIPELDNSEGYVILVFNRKESDLVGQKTVLVNGISGILGNRPNLTVSVESVKAVSQTQTEVKITVTEKGVTGSSKKIPSSDLAAFLNQPTQKQQLNNVGVASILPYVTPSKTALEEYKKKPPPGIEPQMWQAANADNPNPQKYIPSAINGFSELKNRMLSQQNETALHTAFIERVHNDVTELKKKHLASIAQITELKQKFLQLQHRILRILVKQESTRKVGLAISPEEEALKGRLEMLHAHLKVPTQFKGQINEMLSRVKMMGPVEKQCYERYHIDTDAQEDIKQFLKMEQNGITHLVNIINSDLKTLKTISEGMNQILQSRNIS